MAIITAIADGESGASVRGKLNDVHDEIVETTVAAFAHVVTNDIIIYTATTTPGTVLLIAAASANKKLLIYNAIASTMNVTVDGDGSDTIDGAGDVILTPGTSILISPLTGGWESLKEPTLYNSDGEIAGPRLITLPSGRNLTVDAFDGVDIGSSTDFTTWTIKDNEFIAEYADLNTPAEVRAFQLGASGMVFTDDISSLGPINAADYSANFIPESLATVRYVDAQAGGAALSSSTVQVKTEADITAAFGAVVPWVLDGKNLQVLENITLTPGNRFAVNSANATIFGVDINSSSLSGDTTTDPLIDFIGVLATDTDKILSIDRMTLSQAGNAPNVSQKSVRSILVMTNCIVKGNDDTGGNIELLEGQNIGISTTLLQNGARIVQGDGTTTNTGVDFITLDNKFLATTSFVVNDQRLIELMPNSVTGSLDCNTMSLLLNTDIVTVPQTTGGIGIYVHASATIELFRYKDTAIVAVHETSRQFVMEDPSSIKLATLDGNTFQGAGELYQFAPTASIDSFVLTGVRGLGFDADGNLLAADNTANEIVRYIGVTSTIMGTPIASPGTSPSDCTWLRGNLISLDFNGNGTVYRHDGFTASTPQSVDLGTLGLGISGVRGLTTDGTNIIITSNFTDVFVFGGNFFDDPGNSFVKSFEIPGGLSSLHGLAYDGVNLLIGDNASNTVVVQKGTAPTTQYPFTPLGGSAVVGIAIYDGGYVVSHTNNNTISIFDASPTVDQSAVTWEVMNNSGVQNAIKIDPLTATNWTPTDGFLVPNLGALALVNTTGSAFADFPLVCVVGNTYEVIVGYIPATALSATFSIRDSGGEIISSGSISVAGDVSLTFVAVEAASTFRIQNGTANPAESNVITRLIQNDQDYRVIESSDKGGSIFDDSTARVISPALVSNVASDISDGGVDVFYAPFGKREKSRLGDETIGSIIITSARDRGQTFQGSFTATTLAPGTNKYELFIVINGEPQEDSVGSNIWIGNGDIQTIVSQAITRDVTDTDEVKLGIRPVNNSINLAVLRAAFSHNE